MISSAQARKIPTHSSRTATSAKRHQTFPTTSINPKLALATGSACFIVLVILILTHLGTYNVALSHSYAQMDVQASTNAILQVRKATHQQKATTTTTTNASASKALVRIDQTSPSQYSNTAEYNMWWPSACSAASMTAVFNSYGHHYQLTDILKVESGLGAITTDQGLLSPEGIDQTAAQFGFSTQTLTNPSINQVFTIANGGKPVIISFPPPALGGHWEGGHILIVLGSTTIKGIEYVHLADSSRLNMQYMVLGDSTTPRTFLYYWQGFAKIVTPNTPIPANNTHYSVVGKPTISADFVNRVLTNYNSPAAGKGLALYNLGVKYGIDPAFALAFFMHESSFGTAGEATTTLSLGNLRCYTGSTCVDTERGGYAAYSSWEAGFEAWYALIGNIYVQQWGLHTIDQIIPKYAPTADHNDEAAYIASLKHALDTWHSGQIIVS